MISWIICWNSYEPKVGGKSILVSTLQVLFPEYDREWDFCCSSRLIKVKCLNTLYSLVLSTHIYRGIVFPFLLLKKTFPTLRVVCYHLFSLGMWIDTPIFHRHGPRHKDRRR